MKKIELRKGHIKSKNFDYYVTTCGRVFRHDLRNGNYKEMYYHISHGYRRVRIKDVLTNTRRYYRVSRLVAKAYIQNVNINYNIVNHKDGNKTNDVVPNLEWCNISMNTQHAYDNNLIKDRGGWISTPYSIRIKKSK